MFAARSFGPGSSDLNKNRNVPLVLDLSVKNGKTDGGRRKVEGGRRKAEGGRRKAEGGRRKTEDGRRKVGR